MTRRSVSVTGIGMTTPAGVGVSAGWSGLCQGLSTAAPDPRLTGMPVSFSCRIPGFDATEAIGRRIVWRTDRFVHLALVTAREALADSGIDTGTWDGSRVGVVIGVGSSSQDTATREYEHLARGAYRALSPTDVPRSMPNMAPAEIAIDCRATGPNFAVSTACASGATAIGLAHDLIVSGTCDIVIAGGAESAGSSRLAAGAFWRMGALSTRSDDPAGASRPFDADRDGFVLGEGAGILVLEETRHARARRATVHAQLAGYGTTCDAHHWTTPHPQGRGTVQALGTALAGAGLEPCDIGHVNAHATSTPANDISEAEALRTFFGTPPPVTATKSVIGHAIAGAGAIEAVVSVLSLTRQTIHPTANLDRLDPAVDLDVVTKVPRSHRMDAVASTSIGFGGQNTALVFTSA
ncbi:beta-ketoacyl-[acyl-carrier-protein] synthase family protein [Streptomyces sp. NBC_01267]|uniref:beta-ketoacyl-[acyl-carrier-protein] synthase family protein n=1 Tax=unclassified Streptomyces TaxID=2593676 RepID=UPI002023F13C|nr:MULTISPECIES: beta-ketoacyl-[acyl-carrier-protein] synthase family protein [unclassified Streptomyces]MCX4553710.1 beta-ketoacyl-[acyl-carrier-protein] synthase family protein [Streptomyces sp. NBC_01500]WSC18635.1 beta-ketoacyl-[acyl-carrier-protein] synthase family protein [Streptomyces sp. NBC_01766]WSV52669.1 beta-ketoacyl-[acyl-carrier-protein] synthase family protein [Streptomyces sp. NBC_01014]